MKSMNAFAHGSMARMRRERFPELRILPTIEIDWREYQDIVGEMPYSECVAVSTPNTLP
jgi:hypothetical protein